jgi:hypothetical protein
MRSIAVAVVMLLAACPPAMSEDCAAPCLSYATSIELQNDWIFASDPSLFESIDLGPTIDTEFRLKSLEGLALVAGITTEQVLDKAHGKDRAFSGIGTYVDYLYAQLDLDPLILSAGKLDPVEFGIATNYLDGIHATDLLGDYDLSERWALVSSLRFEAFDLSHSLTASIFTTDRSFLSDSLFTSRGKLKLSDGGAGNAAGISSFAAVYDVCSGSKTSECYAEGDYGLRLGFRWQKAGHRTADDIDDGITPKDELGYLAAATAKFEIDEMTLRLLGEAAYFEHFDGSPDDALVGTISASLEQDAITYMATYTRQTTLIPGERNTTGHLADFTVQYDLGEDVSLLGEQWKLGAGYSYARTEDGERTHVFSLLATVDLEGSL